MTHAVRHDLPNRGSAFSQASCVIVGFQIADDGRYSIPLLHQAAQSLAQHRRFTCSRTRNQIQDENSRSLKLLPHGPSEFVILL
jgi:hypothetical protein